MKDYSGIVGLSFASVAPTGFSLAGEVAKGRAGKASLVITFIGHGGSLFALGLIGSLVLKSPGSDGR